MKINSILLVSAAFFSLSNIAIAKEDLFKTLDADKNGFISFNESIKESNLVSNFKKFDTDKDDRISPSEFTEYLKVYSE